MFLLRPLCSCGFSQSHMHFFVGFASLLFQHRPAAPRGCVFLFWRFRIRPRACYYLAVVVLIWGGLGYPYSTPSPVSNRPSRTPVIHPPLLPSSTSPMGPQGAAPCTARLGDVRRNEPSRLAQRTVKDADALYHACRMLTHPRVALCSTTVVSAAFFAEGLSLWREGEKNEGKGGSHESSAGATHQLFQGSGSGTLGCWCTSACRVLVVGTSRHGATKEQATSSRHGAN